MDAFCMIKPIKYSYIQCCGTIFNVVKNFLQLQGIFIYKVNILHLDGYVIDKIYSEHFYKDFYVDYKSKLEGEKAVSFILRGFDSFDQLNILKKKIRELFDENMIHISSSLDDAIKEIGVFEKEIII